MKTPPLGASSIMWQGGAFLPLALAVAIVVLLGMTLYSTQLRAQRPLWRWGLPTLRAAALLALAVSVLQPVLVRDKTREEEGAVLILVDHSRSMGVADLSGDSEPARAQLVTLADSLGRLPAGASIRQATPLNDAVRKLAALDDACARLKNELDISRMKGKEDASAEEQLSEKFEELARAGEEARSIAGRLAPNLLDDLNRLIEAVRRQHDERRSRDLLDRIEAGARQSQIRLDAELYTANADVRRACDELARMPRFDLARLLVGDPRAGLLQALPAGAPTEAMVFGDEVQRVAAPSALAGEEIRADAAMTDVAGSLRGALQSPRRRDVQAVVLFSDGRDTAPAAVESERTALSTGAPVYVVPISAQRTTDVWIKSLRMAPSVLAGQTLLVRAEVEVAGMRPEDVIGTATLAAGETVLTQPLQIAKSRTVEFALKLDKPGPVLVTVSLSPQKHEALASNNRAERWVKVTSQRLRVLLAAAAPTREYRFLRDLLSRDASVTLTDALLDDPEPRLAADAREILRQDVVVLDDVAVSALDAQQWDAVERLALERGGSILLIAGESHCPIEYDSSLNDLLPYKAPGYPTWQTWPGEAPDYHVQPTQALEELPGMQFGASPAANQRKWDQLAPFYRCLALGELKEGAQPLLVERESRLPLLTEAALGKGRIFFMAFNETWRWRASGGREHDEFWMNLLRHAGEEPYAANDQNVWLDSDRLAAQPNETLHIRAKVERMGEVDEERRTLDMTVLRNGEYYTTRTLQPVGGLEGGRFAGALEGLQEGEYELRVDDWNDAAPAHASLRIHIAENFDREMTDITPDVENLARIARSTGGRLVRMDEFGSIPRFLAEAASRQPRVTELPLWDSAYLYAFVLACFCAEWAVRKKLGLA